MRSLFRLKAGITANAALWCDGGLAVLSSGILVV
jgi:hypothetical protein